MNEIELKKEFYSFLEYMKEFAEFGNFIPTVDWMIEKLNEDEFLVLHYKAWLEEKRADDNKQNDDYEA